MYEGIWTISPCPHGEVGALAEALGVSETTARVLVRRGYDKPEEAKAFLAGELPFTGIPDVIERVLEELPAQPVRHFSDLYSADGEARERARALVEGVRA